MRAGGRHHRVLAPPGLVLSRGRLGLSLATGDHWAVERTLASELVTAALHMALARRHPLPAAVSLRSRNAIREPALTLAARSHQNTSSMSRRGNCWDNAPVKSFLSNLKAEQWPANPGPIITPRVVPLPITSSTFTILGACIHPLAIKVRWPSKPPPSCRMICEPLSTKKGHPKPWAGLIS